MDGARGIIGVVGAGVMGAGIAQVAAAAGHGVRLFDAKPGAAAQAKEKTAGALARLVEKGKLTAEARDGLLGRIEVCGGIEDLAPAQVVIEAIVEDAVAKRALFAALEKIVAFDAVLATNTSSLLIEDVAVGLVRPERAAGLHFFNPAPLMPLVEVVAGRNTSPAVADGLLALAKTWGKTPVLCQSSPGFIVNRCARPFYAEPLRFLEEGGVDAATVDALLRAAGFKMGPLELIDLVGLDINLAATRSICAATGNDPRYEPSRLVQEQVAAGRLGRKSGRGFFDYTGAEKATPTVLPRAGAPKAIVVQGNLGPAQPLIKRWHKAGVEVMEHGAGPGLLECEGVKIALTDGRTAVERARSEGGAWAMFDLALDFSMCGHFAVAGSDEATARKAAGLFQMLGMEVSLLPDRPGLLVARTVAALVNEAADIVLCGVASVADVDTAMRLGLNFPGGPLGWADRIGAMRLTGVLDALAATHAQRYRVCPLLREKAERGGRFHA